MCSECFTNFASSDDLKGHVNQDHSGLVSTRQLTAFVDQSKRLVESIQPSECPFCDDSWAQADSSLASREEVLVVDLDQFRRHLGKHLQQVALFSLPRLTHDHDQSLGPHGDAEYSDRDAIPKGCQWIRDDCGRGWSIVLRKRTTFVALASFLNLCRMKSHTHEKPYPLVPLLASLERVDEELVQLLCAPGADFILGGPNGNSLQTASEKGHEGIVRLLLNYEAEVDAQAGPYGNALQTASAEGRKSMLQLLRNYEADFHGAYGSVLQEAPNVRNYIVKLLLNHKADVNAQGGPYGNALQAASSNGHDQIVQLLLSHQADVNAQGGPYGSALQAASFHGYNQIVQLLLNHKADVNAQGGPYGSALQAASFHGYNQIVQLLLNHKADVNAQGGPYGSALQAASFHGYNQIVKLLLNHKVDVNAQGRKYGSALQTASSRGHDQIVQLLLSHKADVNAQGGPYGSALQAASFHGHDQIVRLLLSHKADVNAQGGMYGNALQAASSKGHTNIMRRLLDSGADGNVQDLGYAFITVSVDNTDHKLLLRLLDSVGHLKQRITKEIPSVLETLTADPTRSVRLIFDGKPLIDESLECKELGLRQGSTVSCLFESGSTGTEAQA